MRIAGTFLLDALIYATEEENFNPHNLGKLAGLITFEALGVAAGGAGVATKIGKAEKVAKFLDKMTDLARNTKLPAPFTRAVDKALDESKLSLPRSRSNRLARLAASNYSRRASELVEEAASASGVKLSDIVDEVRSTLGPSFFDLEPDTGRRILAISEGSFSRSRSYQLVESAHEIIHAQRYNNVLRARSGD